MPTINLNKNKRVSCPSNRRKERQLIYNTPQWKNLSKAFKMANPLCEECLKKGIIKEAQHIHHIQSFMSVDDELRRMELAYDWNNLQSLCVECHQIKHQNNKNKITTYEKDN